MKNYWFISEFYWPIGNSTGHIITRIIDAFTKENKAHIITVGNINSKERNQNTYTIRINDYISLNKNNLFQRLIKLVTLSFMLTMVILKNIKQGDIVVTVTNPAFIVVFLACIKVFKRIKLITIVQDIFPENLIVARIISKNNLLYKITKKIFDFAYNMNDLLIVCGRDMQKTIELKVNNKNKVKFIPNFGDTDILYPMEKKHNSIIVNLGIEKKFIVLFTGNIGRMQNIDNLINTAELLKEDSSLIFLFIGEGACQQKVRDYSAKNHNVILLPNMPREESLLFLNAGDVGVSSLISNIMGVGVPSKTYSYMATGKPIIAVMDNDAEIAMMIQEENNGWVVEANNPLQFAALLKQIKDDCTLVKEKGEISYKLSKTKYSIENITNQYIQAIINL